MYAIVEPYVICAQLQAEVMKRGLNLNIIGAGCSTSIVASACAYFGAGPSSYYMGHNSENLLGQEWVTPAGEVIRTGSLSSGCGWFCSEGPGPSPRGITRGALGSRGGLGTYTKCAIKLSPWQGPPVMEPKGTPAGLSSAHSMKTSASTPSARPIGMPGRTAITRSTTTTSATSSIASSTSPAPIWRPRCG